MGELRAGQIGAHKFPLIVENAMCIGGTAEEKERGGKPDKKMDYVFIDFRNGMWQNLYQTVRRACGRCDLQFLYLNEWKHIDDLIVIRTDLDGNLEIRVDTSEPFKQDPFGVGAFRAAGGV